MLSSELVGSIILTKPLAMFMLMETEAVDCSLYLHLLCCAQTHLQHYGNGFPVEVLAKDMNNVYDLLLHTEFCISVQKNVSRINLIEIMVDIPKS